MNLKTIEAISLQRITKSLVIFIAILAIGMLSTAGVSAQGADPDAPTGLTATPGDQEISLDWDDGVDLTYNVHRGDATSGPYDTQVATGLTGSEYVDTELINGTTYFYVVTSEDAANNESDNSDEASATPQDLTAPDAPSGLVLTAGDMQITLDWDDLAELGVNYNVYRGVATGGPYTSAVSGAALVASEFIDPGLINGTEYFYVVTTEDAANNESENSDEASATPQDPGLPTITGTAAPEANATGWNNTDVAVTFECTDDDPGIDTCVGDQILTDDGAGQSVEGTATDLDGNIAMALVEGINIDQTAPVVNITTPADGAIYPLGEDVLADWEASDALSGITSSSGTVESGQSIDTSVLGLSSFTVLATDNAGNDVEVVNSYTVIAAFAAFEATGGLLQLNAEAYLDQFEVEGTYQTEVAIAAADIVGEEVTVRFNGFQETIPAGSMVRNGADDGLEYPGAAPGIFVLVINDDGSFRVEAAQLDLSGIVATDPVEFSLSIGDQSGRTEILFGEEPFLLEDNRPDATPPPAGDPITVDPPERDFFGTVIEVNDGYLLVSTKSGDVMVEVYRNTKIRIPRYRNADAMDFKPGDVVAVSMDNVGGEYIGGKIHLIPGKTRNRSIPGIVTDVSGSTMTIQPVRGNSGPITFDISSARLRYHRGEQELVVGSFVVVSAVRDPTTGGLSLQAKEINVTSRKIKVSGTPIVTDTSLTQEEDSQNTVEIQGALEEVDQDGNLIVNGITVFLEENTVIESGLVVGQILNVEAILQEDGTVLALLVEEVDESAEVASVTELEGTFDGVDEDGNWIIGGTSVSVGPGSDTDGLPNIGQLVRVKALLQDDGTLLAREIENKRSRGKSDGHSKIVKLKGIFQGTDEDGNWIVSGRRVGVDGSTRLEGTPAVGRRITVEADRRNDGALLAKKLESDRRGQSQSKREAKIRGTVEEILEDGSLVIDGTTVAVETLTELDANIEVGDFVQVEALISEDGSLVAKEVDRKGRPADRIVPEISNVQIQGIIESIDDSGTTLVVNGITITIGDLSEVQGTLEEGSIVRLEGVLLPDGTVSAQGIKGQARRSPARGVEAKVQGRIDRVIRDGDGNIQGLVVDGLAIALEQLTERAGDLLPGAEVSINAIISNGRTIASSIKSNGGRRGQDRSFEAREERNGQRGDTGVSSEIDREPNLEAARQEHENARSQDEKERELARQKRVNAEEEEKDGKDNESDKPNRSDSSDKTNPNQNASSSGRGNSKNKPQAGQGR